MYQGFLNLKRDITDFVGRLDQYIIDQGVALEEQANVLKLAIEGLQGEIDV